MRQPGVDLRNRKFWNVERIGDAVLRDPFLLLLGTIHCHRKSEKVVWHSPRGCWVSVPCTRIQRQWLLTPSNLQRTLLLHQWPRRTAGSRGPA